METPGDFLGMGTPGIVMVGEDDNRSPLQVAVIAFAKSSFLLSPLPPTGGEG
jgi:hypothetical protein